MKITQEFMRPNTRRATSGWVIPKWAAVAFKGAAGCALTGDIKSWDEVFGKPNSRKQGRKWTDMDTVYFEVLDANGKGEAIDDLLFERIGKEFKIGGKTKVKELYRAARDEWNRRLSRWTRFNAGK